MKKIVVKMIIPTLTLLMVLSMTSFAKADNTVTASFKFVPPYINLFVVTPDVDTTPSGVVHINGVENIWGALTIGTTQYKIFGVDGYNDMLSPNTDILAVHRDAVWYVYTGTPGVSANGFSGNIEMKLYDYSNGPPMHWSWADVHGVLQGFGSFAGQTLNLDYDGPGNIALSSWTGFVVVH